MRWGVVVAVLLAIGALLSPELQSNPLTWLIAAFVFLGAAGMIYGFWLDVRSKQAMIETERNTRR